MAMQPFRPLLPGLAIANGNKKTITMIESSPLWHIYKSPTTMLFFTRLST